MQKLKTLKLNKLIFQKHQRKKEMLIIIKIIQIFHPKKIFV